MPLNAPRPPDSIVLRAGDVEARVSPFGARLMSLVLPDRDGRPGEVLLAPPEPDDPAGLSSYFGAICGRYGNRIREGRFSLDGTEHRLSINEAPNHLHGGIEGFDRRSWQVDERREDEVLLSLVSPDGDQGYPGTLQASVRYTLRAGALGIEMRARTDAPTVVNLVNHAYWNLSGQPGSTILDHALMVRAWGWLPVDERLIPLGHVETVTGTVFDLRGARLLGEVVAATGGFGYDHCFTLDGELDDNGLRVAARLHHPDSGRRILIRTSEPGLQVYTGVHFGSGEAPPRGRDGQPLPRYAGIALETQHFPDGPNRPGFPSPRLDPDETYQHLMRIDWAADDRLDAA